MNKFHVCFNFPGFRRGCASCIKTRTTKEAPEEVFNYVNITGFHDKHTGLTETMTLALTSR